MLDDFDETSLLDDRLRLIFTCSHPALSVEAPGCADAAHRRRLDRRRDRQGVPGPRVHPSAALGPGQTQDPRSRHSLPRAPRPYVAGAPERGAGGGIPHLQRGVLRNGGRYTHPAAAVRGGHSPGQGPVRAHARYPEALGLLALMLLHDSRRDTRVDARGEIVLLEDQDRGRWDRAQIEEGVALVERSLRMRQPGQYQVQAAIAACHAKPKPRNRRTGPRSPPFTPCCRAWFRLRWWS